jgi:formate/nitrite transporter FocA (FNT family)
MSSDLTTQDPEPKKSYQQILREEILEGRRAMERPLLGILLSSVSAGLDIGFSLFMMAVAHTRLGGELSPGVIAPAALGEIARPVVAHSGKALLLSAVLAGWAMGLLSWLVTAARDTISQIVIVWIITTVIGFAQLHHAIVGSVEVLAGVFAGQGATLADYGRFLGWTTLGNALGGVFFVALLKYGHATQEVGAGGGAGEQPRVNQERRRQAS